MYLPLSSSNYFSAVIVLTALNSKYFSSSVADFESHHLTIFWFDY